MEKASVFKKLLISISVLSFCLILAFGLSIFFDREITPQKPQVLAAEDGDNQKSCGDLPLVKNIKVNCPLCSSPEL